MENKKKVAIIGTVGLPANHGGFETMVKYLTQEKSNDYQFIVFCEKTPKKKQLKQFNNSQLIYLPFKANGGQSIIYDVISIMKSWFKYDTLLILGTPGCVILPFLKIIKDTRTIVNFGGLEWKRDKWRKFVQWYLKITEKIAIKNATIVVADNQYFCDYISKTYNKGSKLIEYGGDHVTKHRVTDNLIQKYPFLNKKYDVSVSRAQPDNNLHLLLEAYSKIPNKNLVLISNYNKFKYGRYLKNKYSGISNLFLQDAVYDLYELDVIRSNAELYIHSHTYCGTAPSLVEAMNLGLPIIAFDTPTNHKTTEDKTIFFKDANELITILLELTDSKKKEISNSMLEIAKRRYTWDRINNEYINIF